MFNIFKQKPTMPSDYQDWKQYWLDISNEFCFDPKSMSEHDNIGLSDLNLTKMYTNVLLLSEDEPAMNGYLSFFDGFSLSHENDEDCIVLHVDGIALVKDWDDKKMVLHNEYLPHIKYMYYYLEKHAAHKNAAIIDYRKRARKQQKIETDRRLQNILESKMCKKS